MLGDIRRVEELENSADGVGVCAVKLGKTLPCEAVLEVVERRRQAIKYLLVEEVAVDIKQRQNAGFVELLFISILVFDLVDCRWMIT